MKELQELSELRPEWSTLIRKADRIRSLFLKDKRAMYEQEIDKHIKVPYMSRFCMIIVTGELCSCIVS